MASANDTVILSIGPKITDASGNTWAITPFRQASRNGTAIGYTQGVVELAYVNGTVWYEDSSGNWYSFTVLGTLSSGPTPFSPLPTAPGVEEAINDTGQALVGQILPDRWTNKSLIPKHPELRETEEEKERREERERRLAKEGTRLRSLSKPEQPDPVPDPARMRSEAEARDNSGNRPRPVPEIDDGRFDYLKLW